MGWDKLLLLVSPLLKSLLKGPPPSFQGLPPIWSVGLFQKANSPTVTCVQTCSHRPEQPIILQNLSASLFLGTPFRYEGTQGSPRVRESFHKHPHPLSFPRGKNLTRCGAQSQTKQAFLYWMAILTCSQAVHYPQTEWKLHLNCRVVARIDTSAIWRCRGELLWPRPIREQYQFWGVLRARPMRMLYQRQKMG